MANIIPVDLCPACEEMDTMVAKCLGRCIDDDTEWNPSQEITAAMKDVLEAFAHVTIERQCDGDWNVGPWKVKGWICRSFYGKGQADKLPLAICRAFLNAHGINEIFAEIDKVR